MGGSLVMRFSGLGAAQGKGSLWGRDASITKLRSSARCVTGHLSFVVNFNVTNVMIDAELRLRVGLSVRLSFELYAKEARTRFYTVFNRVLRRV